MAHEDLGDTTRHVRTCNWWIGAPGIEGVAYEREMKGDLRYRDCTCSLRWREMVRTEREMHNAWRKRAEEAEARLQGQTASDDAFLIADHCEAWNVAHFKRAVSNLARGYIELRELLSNLVNGSAVPKIAIDRMRDISHSNDL